MKTVNGWQVQIYGTGEITKHFIGQVEIAQKNIFNKDTLQEYLDDYVCDIHYNIDLNVLDTWKDNEKLVIDSDINTDARRPLDNEPWGKGIPFVRIIITPMTFVKKIKTVYTAVSVGHS